MQCVVPRVPIVPDSGNQIDDALTDYQAEGMENVLRLVTVPPPVASAELLAFEQCLINDLNHRGLDVGRDQGLRTGDDADLVRPAGHIGSVAPVFVTKDPSGRTEIGVQLLQNGGGQQSVEILLRQHEGHGHRHIHSRQIFDPGFPSPVPALRSLFPVGLQVGKPSGKPLQVSLNGSQIDGVALVHQMFSDLPGGGFVRMAGHGSKHGQLAHELFRHLHLPRKYQRHILSRMIRRHLLDALNPDCDLARLIAGVRSHPRGRFCLHGPPGTGKSEFARYVVDRIERPLLVKRASDLLGPYVGMTEKQIAHMFDEASDDEALLLLDEADSFLRDRRGAHQGWEVTQVNELLTRMERFDGLFICSTNLMDDLDPASVRRFDLKIRFGWLKPEQVWRLFQQVLEDHQARPDETDQRWCRRLAGLDTLAPGDFATVVRRARIMGDGISAESLYAGLAAETAFKQQASRRSIGFMAEI